MDRGGGRGCVIVWRKRVCDSMEGRGCVSRGGGGKG